MDRSSDYSRPQDAATPMGADENPMRAQNSAQHFSTDSTQSGRTNSDTASQAQKTTFTDWASI